MSSMKSLWSQILKMAKEGGMPERPRGILREYLQIKALEYIYSDKRANKLSFIGGTSLRLLRGIPRFSEDLDFDNLGVNDKAMIAILHRVRDLFLAENIQVELFEKITEGKTYFELRFPDLLKELEISTNPREKLMIKVDYGRTYKGQETEVILLARTGIIQQIVTNKLDQILVEKLSAYANRHTIQSRDMYDVVWLYSQGARVDKEFVKVNKLDKLISNAKVRWENEGVTVQMKRKLAPFLFAQGDEAKIDLFGRVLESLELKE